jgi:hypothetical protein
MPLKRPDLGARLLEPAVRRVAYPGELGAAPTGLSFSVPADWHTAPVRGALAVARAPEPGAHGLHANLVLSIERVTDQVTLSGVAQEVLRDARHRAEALVVIEERLAEVAALPALRREQRLEAAAVGVSLVQFVVLLLAEVGDGAARDCIQITATGEATEHGALRAVFDEVCESLRLGP